MSQLPQSLSTKIELYISCQKLVNKDVLSKSDPAVEVQMRFGISPNYQWRAVGKKFFFRSKRVGTTEMVKDKLSPVFNKTITVDYKFEEQQPLVYDIDQKVFRGKIDKSEDELLGTCEASLGEICGARGQVVKKRLQLKNKKNAGYCVIRAEEVTKTRNDTLIIKPEGIKLKKMDTFGKSDPYFILKRKATDGTWQQIYKSDMIKNTLNPKWKQFKISISKLCRGDLNKNVRMDVWDWNKIGKPDFIGYYDFKASQLVQRKVQDFKLKEDKKGGNRGTIRFNTTVIKNFTFFEYLTGGMEISLLVAIDFTGSNGNPNQPGTLHYHSQGFMNEYESAIRSVGEILVNYDTDNQFPLFGFGARLPNGQVSHCFALNGNSQNPEVVGVDGILKGYHQALTNVQLYGPTYFSEVVNVATTYSKSSFVCQDLQKYYILLIITDGIINDMQKTIDAIVEASYQPMSIVIVGVGNANFDAMDELDCDDGLLKSSYNKLAQRDIVQFVPFSKFKNMGYEGLAKETLAEIPGQVVKFFGQRKISPNQRPTIEFKDEVSWNLLKSNVNQKENWNVMKGGLSGLVPQPSTVPGQNPELVTGVPGVQDPTVNNV